MEYIDTNPHPGDILKEELSARGWQAGDLASKASLSTEQVQSVLQGSPIDGDVAFGLGRALGTGPDIWVNLQKLYDEAAGSQDKGSLLA